MTINLNLREKSKLYLAITRALNVPEDPQTREERARAEWAEAIIERDPAEMFATMAVADDIAAETAGHDYYTSAKAVAQAYSIDTGRARLALRLAGWVHDRGDGWESEPGARTVWHPEPCDMLAAQFE